MYSRNANTADEVSPMDNQSTKYGDGYGNGDGYGYGDGYGNGNGNGY